MLIKCPECGKDVSDKASACIHCGFPLNDNDINLKVTCVINHVECNVAPIKEYISILSTEEQKYFVQFLQLQYGSSDIRPSISNEKYTEFHEKMGEWANIYKLTNKLAAKLILDCMANNFEHFTFDATYYAPKPAPQPDPNVVRCPKCGSTSVTTQERGYSIMWGVLGSTKKKNLCQKCGYTWWPGAGK